MGLTQQQEKILESKSKNLVVSASAGSGKTFVLIEKLIDLICQKKIPVSRLLVLTFTKAAAEEMKSRLYTALLAQKATPFILEQLDDISITDISTIDSFCEKIIKRNIIKLDVDEGFSILDEKSSWRLKKRAFASAFDKSCEKPYFDEVYFAFKKNKERLEECITSMQNYFDSLSSEKEQREKFFADVEIYNARACRYIIEQISKKIDHASMLLKSVVSCDCNQKSEEFAKTILSSISEIKKDDLFVLSRDVVSMIVPDLPRAKEEVAIKEILAQAKDYVKQAKEIAGHFAEISEGQIQEFSLAKLSRGLMQLYEEYYKKYTALKKGRNALDFADIERYAKVLLEDEEIKEGLQSRYDYIFIDEYQDTNRLQESILKPIAQKGHFTAVGDIKQGIYGFRNANKEIMQEDINDFAKREDGEALYLTGNFRTDNNILSFVNHVFEKIMTNDNVGIDYKTTSMLEGLREFKKGTLPAVSIDVVDSSVKSEQKINEGIYSVKEDSVAIDEKNKNEILAIATRVEEALTSEIYDAKKGVFRKVNQSDIALLFRNRTALMQETVKYLQNKGFNVNADIKTSLLEDSQIRVLCALLKLSINMQDDISLAAVMSSPFGSFSLNELAEIRKADKDSLFWEIVLSSKEEKIIKFRQMIEDFSFDCSVHGVVKAFQLLFNKYNYYDYIDSLTNANEKNVHINELFKLIRALSAEFKPMTIVSALEQNIKQKTEGQGGEDAIFACTIHATKGLEYPIVILCGAGDSLNKVYNKNYILTENFGLGTHIYDFDEDISFYSPAFMAGKLSKSKSEFEGELMVFYVALTRAQNHLYIIGRGKEKDYTFNEIEKQNNYLKLIFFAFGENFTRQLFEQEKITTNNWTFSLLSEVEEQENEQMMKILHSKKDENYREEIEKYQAFSYPNISNCLINYKNSVTGVLTLEEETVKRSSFEQDSTSREDAIKRGNAYHEALKLIDFDKVYSEESLSELLKQIKAQMTEGYYDYIDIKVLYKNINIIKSLLNGQKLFKEKEFLMKLSLEEVGFAQQEEDFVIVQGIIDLFAIGEKNILIDFKFSSIKDENILRNRYQKQIDLYTKAIEKAFGKAVDEKYLLSLGDAKIIKM